MSVRKTRVSVALMLAVLIAGVVALNTNTVLVAADSTVTANGITLAYPNYLPAGGGLLHCEPWNDASADDVTLSGVPLDTASITLQFTFSNGIAGSPLIYPAPITVTNISDSNFSVAVPYPQDHTAWPYQAPDGSSSAIVVAVAVRITRADGTWFKLASKQWKVVCIPRPHDENPFEGCTLGYWKQDQHFDSWTGYAPTDSYDTVFSVTSHLDPPGPPPALVNPTLLQALEIGGGGENGMARQAVAALLNAASAGVNYPMTIGEVITAVQTAYASPNDPYTGFDAAHALFESYNTIITVYPDGRIAHCPLD